MRFPIEVEQIECSDSRAAETKIRVVLQEGRSPNLDNVRGEKEDTVSVKLRIAPDAVIFELPAPVHSKPDPSKCIVSLSLS